MSKSSESKIDRLRKRLNSQQQDTNDFQQSRLSHDDGADIPKQWNHDDDGINNNDDVETTEDYPEEPEEKSGSFLNKLLIFSAVFFVIAFGFAAYSVGFNNSGVSPDNVSISIDGPTAVSAGDTADFYVTVRNDNKVNLQDTELVIAYPEGTRQPSNNGQELRRMREQLGNISAGETAEYTAQASLFGEQGETKSITIQLEYQVEESNAIFTAENRYEFDISEAPLSLQIDTPTEVTANEPFTTNLTVSSNASRTLDNVLLVIDYPFGFSVQEVDPDPDYRQHVWHLGNISPGDQREIEILGEFTDSNTSDQQSFRFDVGTAQDDATNIGTLFASQDITMTLREPYVNVSLRTEESPDRTGNKLDVTARIDWQSNLDSVVRGAEITADLSGSGIDLDTVSTNNGLYRRSDQSITWNSRTNSELANIAPGDSGAARFSFSTNSSQALAEITENPAANISIQFSARSSDSSSLPDPVTANYERSIPLPTVVDAMIDTLHDDGPLETSGPVPPQEDETTTYALHFSVTNTTNEITDAQLQAAVPPYVEFGNMTSPSDAVVEYNDISGRLSWNIGSIPAGAGYTTAPKEVFVLVELTPSSQHAGSILRLLEDISISGTDSFTEGSVNVRGIQPPTTSIDDLRATADSGRVEN